MRRLFFFTVLVVSLALANGALPSAAKDGAAKSADARQKSAVAVAWTAVPPPIDGDTSSAAWKSAAHVTLAWDYTDGMAPGKDTATDVYLLADDRYVYVAFRARQKDGVVASQRTDGAGRGADDSVAVVLSPTGEDAFRYTFEANAIGTRYDSAAEDASFDPYWNAAGRITATGYEVTMRIPRYVMRSTDASSWKVQFLRRTVRDNVTYLWSHGEGQTSALQMKFAGTVTGLSGPPSHRAAALGPRVAVYGLAQGAHADAGGQTSRMGADWTLPVASTVSLYGTAHPDYSNVERDQQTIAPTVFKRVFKEVRPFFTQGAEFYNPAGYPDIYTPSIPTPRNGFGIDGTLGPLKFAAFQAVGHARTDTVQSASYGMGRFTLFAQQVSAEIPYLADLTQTEGVEYSNKKNFGAALSWSTERGQWVLNPGGAYRATADVRFYGPNGRAGIAYLNSGAGYNPRDAYIEITDLHGYRAYVEQHRTLRRGGLIRSVDFGGSFSRYVDQSSMPNLQSQEAHLRVVTRSSLGAEISTGSRYVDALGFLVPDSQSGFRVFYNADSAVPTEISYSAGHYFDGYLHYTTAQTGLLVGRHGTLSLEWAQLTFDDPVLIHAVGRLERVSYTHEFGRDTSLTVGVRTISGSLPPPDPLIVRLTNLSLALVHRTRHDDFYLVYGDPNSKSTKQQLIFKIVHVLRAL